MVSNQGLIAHPTDLPVLCRLLHGMQREVFSPRVSLLMSFEGTMVAELQSMNSILTKVFLFSRWERAVWSAIEMASSVDLLGRYENWSGSLVSGIMVLM